MFIFNYIIDFIINLIIIFGLQCYHLFNLQFPTICLQACSLSISAVSIVGGPAEMLSTTSSGQYSVRFSHRVPVSIELPTVCHLQSIVACDWVCWLCPFQGSLLLVALRWASTFNTKMRELLVHKGAGS